MEQWVTQYWAHYGVVGLFPVWFASTAVVNTLARFNTPQGWIDFADKIPALHAALTLIRGWGVDPVALLEAIEVYNQKKQAAAAAKLAKKRSV